MTPTTIFTGHTLFLKHIHFISPIEIDQATKEDNGVGYRAAVLIIGFAGMVHRHVAIEQTLGENDEYTPREDEQWREDYDQLAIDREELVAAWTEAQIAEGFFVKGQLPFPLNLLDALAKKKDPIVEKPDANAQPPVTDTAPEGDTRFDGRSNEDVAGGVTSTPSPDPMAPAESGLVKLLVTRNAYQKTVLYTGLQDSIIAITALTGQDNLKNQTDRAGLTCLELEGTSDKRVVIYPGQYVLMDQFGNPFTLSLAQVNHLYNAELTQLSFGQMVHLLKHKSGTRVCRAGWNGKGMWLRIVFPYTDPHFPIVESSDAEGTPLPYIAMKTVDNGFVPWLASQTDMLAEDWMVV